MERFRSRKCTFAVVAHELMLRVGSDTQKTLESICTLLLYLEISFWIRNLTTLI